MNKRIFLWMIVIVLVMAFITGCKRTDPDGPAHEPINNMANPASVYCEEHGGTLEIRKGEAGEFGVCHFEDGSECEEWDFFKGECAPGQVFSQ